MTRKMQFEQYQLLFDEFGREGRDPQLYQIYGQWLFPVYSVTGGLTAHPLCYLIARGEGESAPPFEGSFPTEHLEILELGKGWRLIALRAPSDMDFVQLRKVLEEGEAILKTKGTN